tara:strand:- start:311 stop:517 length:207 start_codon:yes stop_codon:yes gene_type:complete
MLPSMEPVLMTELEKLRGKEGLIRSLSEIRLQPPPLRATQREPGGSIRIPGRSITDAVSASCMATGAF